MGAGYLFRCGGRRRCWDCWGEALGVVEGDVRDKESDVRCKMVLANNYGLFLFNPYNLEKDLLKMSIIFIIGGKR